MFRFTPRHIYQAQCKPYRHHHNQRQRWQQHRPLRRLPSSSSSTPPTTTPADAHIAAENLAIDLFVIAGRD